MRVCLNCFVQGATACSCEPDAKDAHIEQLEQELAALREERRNDKRLLNNWLVWEETGGGLGCLRDETEEALQEGE